MVSVSDFQMKRSAQSWYFVPWSSLLLPCLRDEKEVTIKSINKVGKFSIWFDFEVCQQQTIAFIILSFWKWFCSSFIFRKLNNVHRQAAQIELFFKIASYDKKVSHQCVSMPPLLDTSLNKQMGKWPCFRKLLMT